MKMGSQNSTTSPSDRLELETTGIGNATQEQPNSSTESSASSERKMPNPKFIRKKPRLDLSKWTLVFFTKRLKYINSQVLVKKTKVHLLRSNLGFFRMNFGLGIFLSDDAEDSVDELGCSCVAFPIPVVSRLQSIRRWSCRVLTPHFHRRHYNIIIKI